MKNGTKVPSLIFRLLDQSLILDYIDYIDDRG